MTGVSRFRGLQLFAILFLMSAPAQADVDFYQDVYPILKANCIACHNKKKSESALDLETPETVRKGGDSGPGVIAGNAAQSQVYLATTHEGDYVMPPKDNTVGAADLKPEELKTLAAWINAGAKDSIRQVQKVNWRSLPVGVHPIYCVATTDDGRWGACGRADQVAIYDLATRQYSGLLIDAGLATPQPGTTHSKSHHGLVNSLAFSPDGQRIASGSFREVKIWRQDVPAVAARKPLTIPEHGSHTVTLDGKFHVVIDAQGTLQLIDVQSGEVSKSIPETGLTAARALSVSPGSDLLAVAGADPMVQVWNLSTGERRLQIPATAPVTALGWSADGASLAAAGEDQKIRIWAVPAPGVMEVPAPQELANSPAKTVSIHFLSTPNRLIALGSEGQLPVWNLADAAAAPALVIPGTVALAISPDGKLIAAGGADGVVRIWDAAAGRILIELKDDLQTREQLFQLDHHVATQTLELDYYKREVTRLTAANNSLAAVITKANETIATVNKVLPEKQKALAAATAERTVSQSAADAVAEKIAKLEAGKTDAELEKQKTDSQQALMKVSGQESTAQKDLRTSENHLQDAQNEVTEATAATAKNTELLKTANEMITTVTASLEQAKAGLATARKTQAERKLKVVGVGFSKSAQVVAAIYENGEQRVWGVASGMPALQAPAGAAASSGIVVSPVDQEFLTATSVGATTALRIQAHWTLERVLGGDEHPTVFADRVNALQFSPDGTVLAAGGGEPSRGGEISLWKVETGELISTWNDRHSDAVLCLEFSPDGKSLASGASDRLVKVADVQTGVVQQLFEGHTHHALSVTFRADGRILASSGSDGSVLIWDMQTKELARPIKGWNKEVSSAIFLGATPNIVTSSGDSQVRIVNDQGGQVRTIPVSTEFLHAAATPTDGSVILAGGEDGVLHLWKTADGQELAAFPVP